MPFRFRKIFSLGKGFRINLSKGGISSSIGKPGATLNIGKRGARPTFSVPGSGFSFTPSTSSSTSSGTGSAQNKLAVNLISFIISGVLICIISICCIGVIFYQPTGSTPTPTSAAQISIEQIVALTSAAAQTQTMAVASPVPTSTLAALQTIAPTQTLIVIDVPTQSQNTPLPVYETNTPFAFSTVNPIIPADGSCSCTSDALNCTDFQTQASAQACFNFCIAQGAGDIHKLDQNNDGVACESN